MGPNILATNANQFFLIFHELTLLNTFEALEADIAGLQCLWHCWDAVPLAPCTLTLKNTPQSMLSTVMERAQQLDTPAVG